MEVLTAATQYLTILMRRTRATCTKMFASVYEASLESKKRFKAKCSLEILISLHTWSGRELVSNYAHLNRSAQSSGRVPCCSHSSPPPHPHRQTAKPTGHDACEIMVVQSKIEWSYILFASLPTQCCYDNSVLIFCVVATCSFLPLIMYSSIKP